MSLFSLDPNFRPNDGGPVIHSANSPRPDYHEFQLNQYPSGNIPHGNNKLRRENYPGNIRQVQIKNRYDSDLKKSATKKSSLKLNKASHSYFSKKSEGHDRKISRNASESKDKDHKNFIVVVRVRPPLPREVDPDGTYKPVINVHEDYHQISISEYFDTNDAFTAPTHRFTFDRVFDEYGDQKTVFEECGKPAVLSVMEGYNATVFAYGQTSSGKTYTMEGYDSEELIGIIPRSVETIFTYIGKFSKHHRFMVRASCLQIYNDVISDLLKNKTNLTIREDKQKGIYVKNLSEWVVKSPQQVYELIKLASSIRATASTRMNQVSSRSHVIFIIIVEQNELIPDPEGEIKNPNNPSESFKSRLKYGKLNLVDLAGSERVGISGAKGTRLEESIKINRSLSALGNVISSLTKKGGKSHIPYRDSKLTRILEDSLGGNCKTTMMAMIGPALESFQESLSTLKFANRAKHIKNIASINEDFDERTLLKRYELELKRLRNELKQRSQNVVDKRKLLEMQEQKRRAEHDRMQALVYMEKLSRDLLNEKKEKKKLEERIQKLTANMLIGGQEIQETQAFKMALKQEQDRIRKEYEMRLADLEREREIMSEEKFQVDRYKHLLVKQRDIMTQLTERLNERDQSILALTEEIEVFDKQQRMMEDQLDLKTAQLIKLQRHLATNDEEEVSKLHLGNNENESNKLFFEFKRLKAEKEELEENIEEIIEQRVNEELLNRHQLDETQHFIPFDESNLEMKGNLQQRFRVRYEDNIGKRNDSESFESAQVLKSYQERLENIKSMNENHSKDWNALYCILNDKIKGLVDNLASSITSESVGIPKQSIRGIQVLQQLVDGSINAMGKSKSSNYYQNQNFD